MIIYVNKSSLLNPEMIFKNAYNLKDNSNFQTHAA